MIAQLDQEAAIILPPRRSPNLILHCGAEAVDLKEVRAVHTPRSTSSWHPIPHHQLISTVQKTLATTSLRIGTQAHSLSHEGQRYFGLMEIHSQHSNTDYCWVLGLRNSHDKTFPAGIVAGASVFVCDNLSFSGEIKFGRKHTRHINRDLPQLVSRSIGLLVAKWHHQDKRIATYKQAEITDINAHDLVIRATDVGVCSNRLIPPVLKEWREPRHDDFTARNVWSLFNAFTESLKDGNLAELPKRTEALHGLLDTYVGLSA
ncbi:DUF932 domain-containing protein [Prosthecobacter vanneervenii]|uniref:DUF932 domain-containing protein n=1 Tax=Prosthecobacter vanneervenii TaxID=48466 RepID=A0A7W7Y6J5_9BACT|nr:DUF932 domain-containing protein [Prosthecobacter vanneervenii]MBB5030524.1 hypothetical protein [Prosthecobacter vanneervenii]